jgi:hypothetical protein
MAAAAAAAAEYKAHLGPNFALVDAFDPQYLDVEPFKDEDERAERQQLNAAMAEWYGIG